MLNLITRAVTAPLAGVKIILQIMAASIATGPAVEFEDITVKNRGNQIFFSTKLQNGCTETVLKILETSTPVVIEYEITSKIHSHTVIREFEQNPISKKFVMRGSDFDTAFTTVSHKDTIAKYFEKFETTIPTSGRRIDSDNNVSVKIKARIYIRQKAVEAENLTIWPNTPSSVFIIEQGAIR